MRRAVRSEQKEARRQQMIDTAWELFQQRPYTAVNIVDVARAVGVAKGTVYLYFTTKEALFLAILTQQFEGWFAAVNAHLAETGEATVDEMATLFADSLSARPALVRLFALLHVILEQNVDRESALAFKQMLLENVTRTGALLEGCLPFLQPGQGATLLLQIYAIVLGVQQMADPVPVVGTLLQEEQALDAFAVDFTPLFVETLSALIEGLAVQAGRLPAEGSTP